MKDIRKEFDYEVIEKGNAGFLGIGFKQAVIDAWKKEDVKPNFIEMEKGMLKFWKDNKIFEQIRRDVIGQTEIIEGTVIAKKAIERKTGARGLRSIIEEIMRDIMYDIPSNYTIAKCTITKETVMDKKQPEVVIDETRKKENVRPKRKVKKAKKESKL